MHIGSAPCCGCSVHVAMILAHPISQHEAVSTIFISVLIAFRYIRASESPIHRVTCCTYGVLYGGDTILFVHKSQALSDAHTAWSILRPLDYDSVRPPSGWCAWANIGVKWDHESTTLSVNYKKYISFLPSHEICIWYQRLKPKGHFVGKFPCLDAAIHPQAWRRQTPGMLPSPHGDTAI